MARHEIQSTVLSDLALPIYAPIAVRLMEAREAEDDTELLRWIGFDPILALTVLSSANEHKTTGTLDEAVDLLGPEAIRALA